MSEWKTIDSAPRKKTVLVWGGGASTRFGYLDDLDNWRANHGGPIRVKPSHWMHLPDPPVTA